MDHEVVVVGGGIGGLTVAALLAARGLDVCVFERQPAVGGCATNFTKFGFEFEPTYGLYGGWKEGGVHQTIFSELPVEPPRTASLDPAFAIRLEDGSEILVRRDFEEFQQQLRKSFPECADSAVEFYQKIHNWLTAAQAQQATAAVQEPMALSLTDVSSRFHSFVDCQLRLFSNSDSNESSFAGAAIVLSQPFAGMFSIDGGANALATQLAASIKASGGRLRVDAPVLKLAYDSAGQAIGVDLLSGERINASKAIISNLTVWDTFGKLVGIARTLPSVRSTLKNLTGVGAYVMFLTADAKTIESLAAPRLLLAREAAADLRAGDFFFNGGSTCMVDDRRALTVSCHTEVEDWFSFHTDEAETEARDQSMMEECWTQLHRGIPELGDGVEVIETLTPRDYYENTRRKLGMVGPIRDVRWGASEPSFRTFLPNLFMVTDTTVFGGISGVSSLALSLANHIAPKS